MKHSSLFDDDFDKNFDRDFNRAFKFAAFITLLQTILYIAFIGGVIYFIVFACTHWLKW